MCHANTLCICVMHVCCPHVQLCIRACLGFLDMIVNWFDKPTEALTFCLDLLSAAALSWGEIEEPCGKVDKTHAKQMAGSELGCKDTIQLPPKKAWQCQRSHGGSQKKMSKFAKEIDSTTVQCKSDLYRRRALSLAGCLKHSICTDKLVLLW